MARRAWHICLTVGGAAWPTDRLRIALQRLSRERPFLMSGRYAADRVEISYWEEAADCAEAAALALRLWDDHRESAELPDWGVLGLEISEHTLLEQRGEPVELELAGPITDWRPL